MLPRPLIATTGPTCFQGKIRVIPARNRAGICLKIPAAGTIAEVMDDPQPQYPQDLVRHVARSTGLDEATASRVVADVMAYFGQTAEEYVIKRHEDLKSRNRRNDDIWPLIATELKTRRFKAEELSERQLRRIVYG
jgi:hypothetical protein